MAAACVLLLVGGQQFLYSVGKKRVGGGLPSRSRANLETGTKSSKQIDMDWVPKNVLNHLSKFKIHEIKVFILKIMCVFDLNYDKFHYSKVVKLFCC